MKKMANIYQNIKINLKDDRIIEAIMVKYNYAVNGVGQTPEDFARAIVKKLIKDVVKEVEGRTASDTATGAVYTDVDANVIIDDIA